MSSPCPGAIKLGDASVESETDRFHVGLLVSNQSHGSKLLLGAVWMDAGPAPVSWSAARGVHETYHLQRGQLEVSWEGEHNGRAVLLPGDSFYFPPEHEYTLRNVGEEQVFLIYAVTPAPR
jgi:mannose-6-phosphate isomerase-like protein (cupin superfamily)